MQGGATTFQVDGNLGNFVPVSDSIKGLIVNGPAPAGYTLGTVIRMTKYKDATTNGFNDGYDSTNGVYVARAVREFFRLQPEGVLYFVCVAQSITQLTMLTGWYEFLVKSILGTDRISDVSFKRNPASGYTPTLVSHLWNEIVETINAWGAVQSSLSNQGYFPGNLILDGSFCSNTLGSYPDLTALDNAEGVVVCIGQDKFIADSDVLLEEYADTPAYLALMAQRKVAESPAARKVKNPPKKYAGKAEVLLSDESGDRWQKTQFSCGTNTITYGITNSESLMAKGYVFFDKTSALTGFHGAGDRTCIASDSDYTHTNRYGIVQKAKHLTYQFIAPYKNTIVNLKNGKLSDADRGSLEAGATKAVLVQLFKEGNISNPEETTGAGVFIPNDYNFITGVHDTDSNLNVAPETLIVRIAIPILGILRNIEIYIGLTA